MKSVIYLLCALLVLSLASCGILGAGGREAPAGSRGAAPGNTVVISEKIEAAATATISATAAAAPTATAITETAVTVTRTVSGDGGVYARNAAETVALPACFDFDGGASVIPPDAACDFSMLPGPDGGTIEIYPQAGAQLAYGGVFPEPPALAQCAASDAFSEGREIVAPMAAMYVCYRTGEGRVGYLHFTDADLQQAGTLTFDWLTFAAGDGGNLTGSPDLIYRSDTFGFRLRLPATWAGYQATERLHADDERPDVGTVCFSFGGPQPLCVLKIDVLTKAGWNDLEMVPDDYFLAENDRYIFASGPYRPECVQFDEFQCARHGEVPAILAGFSAE